MFGSTALVAFLALLSSIAGAQKAGLSYSQPSIDISQFLTTGKVTWYYTYTTSSVSTTAEFVPLLWGQPQIAQWDSVINSVIKEHGVTHVLGFNEPNEAGQANLDPVTAAELWRQHIEPLKAQGVLLGSPAPSARPNGLPWLQQFMQACSGCTIDFIAMHQNIGSAESVKNAVQSYHNTFPGKPVWVTEWGCEDFSGQACATEAEVSSFMKTVQTFLDGASYVERYAWFGVFAGTNPIDLADSSGHINALGKQYIGA